MPNRWRQTLARGPGRSAFALAGLRFRVALVVGASLTVGVWLFAGFYFSERIALLQEQLVEERAAASTLPEYAAQVDRVVADYRSTERHAWQLLGILMTASLGVLTVAAVRVSRLERLARRQQARDAELQEDLQRLSARLIKVREDERRSIARELHDEIGQLLTAAKVELTVAQRAIEEGGGDPDVLDDVRPIVERALQEVRDLSLILHPVLLDDLGLVAAVDWQIKAFRQRHQVTVRFEHETIERRLRPEVETAAYRIVQEAMTNVAKYAKSSTCDVVLADCGDRLRVEVEDDGQGFSPDEATRGGSGSGLGLVSIRERAAQLGGLVTIESGPGLGTRLVVELPLEPSGEQTPLAALSVAMAH